MENSIPSSDIKVIVEEIKNEKPIDAESLIPITPAQCFTDGKAMTVVAFPEIEEFKDVGEVHVYVPYVITSEKEKIPMTPSALMKYGYYPIRYPSPENRWTLPSVKGFLKNETQYVDLPSVIEDIKKLFASNIDFGDNQWNDVLSCWIVGTYFHRMFAAYPYIHLNGNMSAGKTKVLTLSSLLAFNGEMSTTSTPPYITRMVHENHAMCGIDEAETLERGDDNQVLLAVLNSGYKRGVFVGKVEPSGDRQFKPKKFEAYSPKIFSGIKRIAPTLASRSIPITMIRTANKEIKNREIDIDASVYAKTRDDLYLIMMTQFPKIRDVYQSITDDEIVGREWELWKPILTIAKSASEDLYLAMHSWALAIQKQKKEMLDDDTSSVKFLESMIVLFEYDATEEKFYTLQDIREFLMSNQNPNSDDFQWLRDKPNTRFVGDALRKSGVVKGIAEQRKVGGGKNQRGFMIKKEAVEKALEAYKA